MSIYFGKMLELKAIENKFDRYFLYLRVLFVEDTELFLEIDHYTAENLKPLVKFHNGYRYRLSFNNSWNVVEKHHISILSQTHGEQSEKIHFSCSEDYINKLASIKNCQHINDLKNLDFIFDDTLLVEENPISEKPQQKESMPQIKYQIKFAWAPIAIMSVIFVFLLGFWDQTSLDKIVFNQKVLAQSAESEDNGAEEAVHELLIPTDTIIVEAASLTEPITPSIELNETISYNIPEGNVALTFDDGPSKHTTKITDILKQYNVGGTFFFTGTNIKKYPDSIKYVASNGYSIGSHSMTHSNLKNISLDDQEYEIIESIKLLEEITNEEINLFRPPYGNFTKHVKNVINENQYKMVFWNNDTEDWKTRDADKILNHIKSSDVSGSIILFHESEAVIDALPRIIEYLQEQGLNIVNLK